MSTHLPSQTGSGLVSLVIPTLNRSEFVIRLLRYYANLGFAGVIYLGDSSRDDEAERSLECIRSLEGKLRVEHRRCPDCDGEEAVRRLLGEVTSPYVALLGDDDFLVPSELERAAAFLGEHPDHSLAHGRGAIATIESTAANRRISELVPYRLLTVTGETARERLLHLLGRGFFITLFSVHRTDQMRRAFDGVPLITDHSFKELFSVCLPIIEGKARMLDSLYLVREHHNERYQQRTMVDWVTRPDFASSYQTFRRLLSVEIAVRDAVAIETAQDIVDRAFHSYLAQVVSLKYYLAHGRNGLIERLRDAGRRVPGLRATVRRVRRLATGSKDDLSLAALMRPSSPYHGSFMPVHDAIAATLPQELAAAS